MEKSGFDAIRYTDVSKPSWAFSHPEKLFSPYGKTSLGRVGEGGGIFGKGTDLGNKMMLDKSKKRPFDPSRIQKTGKKAKYIIFDPETSEGYIKATNHVPTDKDLKGNLDYMDIHDYMSNLEAYGGSLDELESVKKLLK